MADEEKVENLDEAFNKEKVIEVEVEKTWKDYGLEKFDGMSTEDIAKQITDERADYGRLSENQAETKKQNEDYQSQIAKMKAITSPATEEKVEEKLADMNEFEMQAFFASLEKNPRKAIKDLLKDQMGVVGKDDIQKMIDENISKAMGDYDNYSNTRSVQRSRPEHAEHESYVEFLSKPEHLGDARGYEDKLDFAVLHKENKALADVVYGLLKTTNLPFAQCKEFAELQLGAKGNADETVEDIKKIIKGVDGADTSKASKKKGSETEKIESMDDAFDNV